MFASLNFTFCVYARLGPISEGLGIERSSSFGSQLGIRETFETFMNFWKQRDKSRVSKRRHFSICSGTIEVQMSTEIGHVHNVWLSSLATVAAAGASGVDAAVDAADASRVDAASISCF